MFRIILTAALAALWAIAFDTLPANVSNTPALSGYAQAGTTVKSSKSNTSDRKGKTNKKQGTGGQTAPPSSPPTKY